MKASLVLKIYISVISLVFLVSAGISIPAYMILHDSLYKTVEERLEDQALNWRQIVGAYNQEIIGQEQRVRKSAQNIVTAQAQMTYELIEKYLRDGNGTLEEAAKNDLLDILSKKPVGKTGYIWILNGKGEYILSKDRLRDGENIWETKDSEGNYVIQDLVAKGLEVKGPEIAIHSYYWLNKDETIPREKIAAILNFPELGWIVGVSTYYDDLVDMGYRQRTKERVKDLISKQAIGRSGYIWVVNSKGEYIVSKDRQRDGEDISQSKDANGVFFIQEAIKKAKAAGAAADFQAYPWINKNEKSPRMKVAGLTYAEEWDWIIGASAYYDDFQIGALGEMKIMTGLAIFFSVLLGLVIAHYISRCHPSRSIGAIADTVPDPEKASMKENKPQDAK